MWRWVIPWLMMTGPVLADNTLVPCNSWTRDELLAKVQEMVKRNTNGRTVVYDLTSEVKGPNGQNACSVHMMTSLGEIVWRFTMRGVNGRQYVFSLGARPYVDPD